MNRGVTDVFNFVLQEVLTAHNTAKCYVGEICAELPADQIAYLEVCMRFLGFSYVFYQEERVVKDLFEKIRLFVSQKSEDKCEQFEKTLNALTFFSGFGTFRKHALRLLYLIVFTPFWLRVKVTKLSAHAWRSKREVTFLIPDFCQDTFLMLVPFRP